MSQVRVRDYIAAIKTIGFASVVLVPVLSGICVSGAKAQQAPVGDSQTTVRGYVQPSVQGNNSPPAQDDVSQPVAGDQGPPFEGHTQAPGGAYNDTPTAVQESVKGRGRPEYEPNGIVMSDFMTGVGRLMIGRRSALPEKTHNFLSSFILNTSLDFQEEHTSNLYRTQTDRKADDILHIRPGFTIGSDWANDEVRFDAGVDIGNHRRNGTEDYRDYHAALSGRLDMFQDEALSAGLRFDHLHVQRGSPEDPGSPVPTLYNRMNLNLGYRSEGGVVFNRTDFQANYYDYLHNGGVENDDRDRAEFEIKHRIGYESSPGTRFFIEPALNTRRYVRGDFNGSPDHSSKGGQVLTGFTWDYSGVTFFEFGAGYLRQEYDDPEFSTIQGPTANVKAVWNATDLLTITGAVNRQVAETALVGESGVLTTVYSLSADWEAMYNLIVDTGFSHTTDDYRGSARSDDLNNWTMGARYLLNQNWYTEARVSYDDRTSSVAGSGFTDQRFLITVGERL